MKPVPIHELENRLPTAGRVRIGRKVPTRGGGERPDKLATFRFTSEDKASIDQVAGLYGGEVTPWKDHSGQWEVFTPAKMIKVALPPDPLGNTPIYELWSGGGCVRRCTGVKAMVRVGSPDGGDLVEQDCVCFARDQLECQRKTRLSVILPEVRFLGVWRLDTNSEHASVELPGMVSLFQHLSSTKGLQHAELRLQERMATVWSPKRAKWVQSQVFIPVLGFDESVNDMAGPPIAALPPGPPTPPRGLSTPEVLTPEVMGNAVQSTGQVLAIKAYHPDPELVKAWKESLTARQQAKVLQLVRERWDATMPPATFEEIPLDVIDQLMEQGITGEFAKGLQL